MPKKIYRFPRYDVGEVSLAVIETLNKKYRKDKKNEFVLEMLKDSVFSSDRPHLKLGIPPLDEIVGLGKGFPTGIVEIYGPHSSGKTAIIELATAKAQRKGWYVLFFCAEYSLNYDRCIKLGIKEDRLIMLDAETLEDFFDQVKDNVNEIRKVDTNTPILVVWDSIAATPVATEMEQEDGLNDNEMAKLARQMSKLFKRMARFLFKNKVCMLAVNQTRSKIGQRYGNPEATSGGKALGFYAWVRLRLAKAETIRDSSDRAIGYMIEARTTKNKTGAWPEQTCKFPIMFEYGIDAALSCWEFCVERSIFKKDGTAYKYRGNVVTRRTFAKYYAAHRKDIKKRIHKDAFKKAA